MSIHSNVIEQDLIFSSKLSERQNQRGTKIQLKVLKQAQGS